MFIEPKLIEASVLKTYTCFYTLSFVGYGLAQKSIAQEFSTVLTLFYGNIYCSLLLGLCYHFFFLYYW